MDETQGDVVEQSSAIPYRMEEGSPRVLLITSRSRKRWIVPKGIRETWQTSMEAAMEEAYEEAGVRGALVGEAVGEYEYKKWGGTCLVKVYLMHINEIDDEWPEADFRERRWVKIEEALELIDNANLRRLIKTASSLMK